MSMQWQWMAEGIQAFGWLQLALVGLLTTHVTIVAVTLYPHRCQTHGPLALHLVVAHGFRVWLWLTIGMVTRQWVAVHRCHHAHCETAQDPHSPIVAGIHAVLWRGADLYREAIKRPALVARFGGGVPDDWLERRIYSRYDWQGVGLLLLIELVLFGARGLTLWVCQMMWIPFFAAGVVNGIGHYAGYRNYDYLEAATNIVPLGLLIGGEELHNNHDTFPTSAKFSVSWFEVDLGSAYIRALVWLRVAWTRRPPQPLTMNAGQLAPTLATLRQVLSHRAVLMREFTQLMMSVFRAERSALAQRLPHVALTQAKYLLPRSAGRLSAAQLEQVLVWSQPLNDPHLARQALEKLWERSPGSQDQLLNSPKAWCVSVECSGPHLLRRFARQQASYGQHD